MGYKILGALLDLGVLFYAIKSFVVPLNNFHDAYDEIEKPRVMSKVE
jgi:hypothetical protein